jgi:hypothetical protein
MRRDDDVVLERAPPQDVFDSASLLEPRSNPVQDDEQIDVGVRMRIAARPRPVEPDVAQPVAVNGSELGSDIPRDCDGIPGTTRFGVRSLRESCARDVGAQQPDAVEP